MVEWSGGPPDSIGQNLPETPWLDRLERTLKQAPWLHSDKIQNNPNQNLGSAEADYSAFSFLVIRISSKHCDVCFGCSALAFL